MTTRASDLIERARTFVRDSAGNYVLDTDLMSWANEGQADLAARLHLFEHSVEDVTTGATITLPPTSEPDLVAVDFLSLAGIEVAVTDQTTWNTYSTDALQPPVTLAVVVGTEIRLYPTPDVGTAFVLRYSMLPDPMEDGEDELSIPRQLERKLVAYMVAMSQMKMNDDASAMFAIYEQGLPQVEVGRERFFVTPMSMTLEPGPFEMDPASPT